VLGLLAGRLWLGVGFAVFAAGALAALPIYCGLALLIHDRLVRRGWPIERIGLWMRGVVLIYWMLPLTALTALGMIQGGFQ
jgi:hypothetical protein